MAGIPIPQVITPDRATGAQVIDGSLKFDDDNSQYLKRTPGSAGNRRTWTWSGWVKRFKLGAYQALFGAEQDSSNRLRIEFSNSDTLIIGGKTGGSTTFDLNTTQVFRDCSSFYHIVFAVDTTQSTANDRIKVYVNGTQITSFGTQTDPSENHETFGNSTQAHAIGAYGVPAYYLDGGMSNVYLIDGQALDASYFGFTDPLTNTWKPKKYDGTFGTNGFYLPMDGNSPIGKDQSGQGNDYTPVNFGGSVALDNPQVSGARPILNTTQGGSQAGVGVFGSKENKYYTVTTANGSVYQFDITSGDNPSLEFNRGATYRFDYSSHTSHPLLFSSSNPDSSTTAYIKGTSIASNVISFTVPHDAPDTLYYYCSNHPTSMNGAISITTDNTKADQYASNVVLALPLVGANSDVSASIGCTSSTKTITSNGNAAASSDQSNFYSGSFEFDGTGDYLSVPQSTDFQFSSSAIDFTIEAHVYGSAFSGAFTTIAAVWGGGGSEGQWLFSVNASGVLGFAWSPHSNSANFISGGTLSTNKWHHVAVTRSGNTFRLFLDGAETASGTSSATNSNNTQLSVGRYAIGYSAYDSSEWEGYIQDVRIYKGVAKYTSDFVVPSTSPDILPDTPSGVSGDSKLAKIAEGAVSFDGSGDYLSIADSEDLELGSGSFTIEAYIYPTGIPHGTYATIFAKGAPLQCYFMNTNSLGLFVDGDNSGSPYSIISNNNVTGTGSIPQNMWSHIAICRSGDNWKVFVNGVLKSNSTATGTIFNNTSVFSIGDYAPSAGTYEFQGFISNFRLVKGTALYTANFTPSTAPLTKTSQSATETEVKLLCCKSNTVAGTAVTSPGMGGVNDGTVWSSTVSGGIGPYTNGFDGSLSSYMYPRNQDAEGNLVFAGGLPCDAVYCNTYSSSGTEFFTDSASSPTSVNTSSSFAWVDLPADATVLNQIKGTGGAGYNAFAIAAFRKDGVTLLDPLSPLGDVTASNFTPFNTIDTVRGQETGYCTVNPLANGGLTLSNGNLDVTGSGNTQKSAYTTFAVDSGKWYFEFLVKQTTSGNIAAGVANVGNFSLSTQLGATSTSWSVIAGGSTTVYKYHNSTVSSIGSYSAGTIINIAFDVDGGNIWFGINGSYVDGGNPYTGDSPVYSNLTGTLYPMVNGYGTSDSMSLNFGQKPFKFPPPAGFQPLNAANVRPTTVISRPDQYVGVTTYTGNGSTKTISGLNHKADLVWLKSRTAGGGSYNNHVMVDSVRGKTDYGYRNLYPNLTDSEYDPPNVSNSSVTSLNSNRFNIGGNLNTNYTTATYVAWTWKAGGNKNTFNVDDVGYATAADAGLTGGTITPSGASVGTKQGFSIVKFTGPGSAGFQSVPHGLSEKPKFILCKDLDNARNWGVFHEDVITADTQAFILNSNSAVFTSGTACWDVSAIDATTFTPYFRDDFGASYGADNVAYLWHDVPGLQKFGSYTGNGSSDGPFVELGFRPTLLIVRRTDGDGDWFILDTTRAEHNPVNTRLWANLTNAESSSSVIPHDILSNGFKVRNTETTFNASGGTFIYAAWAEAPTVDLYGGGANAR